MKRRRWVRWLSQDRVFKWLPLFPVQAFFLFLALPFVLLVYLSFHAWRVTLGPWWLAPFAGVEKFLIVLQDERFLASIGRTIAFVLTAVPVEFALGLVLALLAYQKLPGRRLFMTAFLIPVMMVPVVIGFNFDMIFTAQGPFNRILSLLSGQEIRVNWLADYTASKAVVVMADVWQWTPLMFLILVAGLAGLPKEVINAARLMGATPWQTFWRVKLPLLRPVIVIAVIVRTMEAFKLFDSVMLLTQGGPGTTTETVAVYLYRVGWDFSRVSDAAAMSVILLVITTAFVFFAIRSLKAERLALETGGR